MKRGLMILFLGIVFLMGSVSGASYYVSIEGSDSDSGTVDSPWRTIQHSANLMVAGDTVYVRGGEYHECIDIKRSGSSGKPITYIAYPGEHPIIDGAGVTCTAWHGTIYANGPDYIIIDGFEIRDTNDYAIRSMYGSHWIIQNCKIHDVGIVVGHRNGVHIDDATDLLFKNNEIYHSTWNGFSAERCDRCVLEGNYVHDNEYHYGMQIFGDSYEPLPEEPFFHDNIVRNNIVTRNSAGLYFRNNINLIISGNVIYKNDNGDGYSGIHFGQGAGCSGSFNSNSKIYSNTIVGQKVSIYNEAFNYLDIKNNIFYNPTNSIFNFASDASSGHTIDYNLYYGKDYSEKGSNGFYANPLFVDATNDDYSLQSDSPACGAGENGIDIGAIPCDGGVVVGCGNSVCDGDESCKSCPADCGNCVYPSSSLTNSNTMIANSNNFASNRQVENLWDGCTSVSDDSCTSGNTGISSFWIEFDLGNSYTLNIARLFGDAEGTWTSKTWQLQYKLNSGDAWTTAFSNVNVFFNDWSEQQLDIDARYVRVEVFSDTGGVQARELEIYGTILQGSICGPSDTNSDGIVSISELINYISEWKIGNVLISELIDAIGKWKSGC
jgi:parallel beta-helix repeat protein